MNVILHWHVLLFAVLIMTAIVAAMRLTICDYTVNGSNGRSWIGLPVNAQIGAYGELFRRDGKLQSTPARQFDSRHYRDAFSAAVLAALDARAGRAAAWAGRAVPQAVYPSLRAHQSHWCGWSGRVYEATVSGVAEAVEAGAREAVGLAVKRDEKGARQVARPAPQISREWLKDARTAKATEIHAITVPATEVHAVVADLGPRR